jgi:hypothetical protein
VYGFYGNTASSMEHQGGRIKFSVLCLGKASGNGCFFDSDGLPGENKQGSLIRLLKGKEMNHVQLD